MGRAVPSLGYRYRAILAAAVFFACVGPAMAATRLALVIGNGAYASTPLPTSANDAGLVAETLAQAGFDVTAAMDADGATYQKAVLAFETKARSAGADAVFFVYVAGLGLQVDGDNYLVPIDAKIARASDVASQAMRLADLTAAIEGVPAQARIFVYDLARANRFAGEGDMPLAGGLALTSAPKGSLYAFNAAPGTIATTDTAPYGVYARALSEQIKTPDLSPVALFARTRLRVGELTDGAVIPWDDDAIGTPMVFIHGTGATSSDPLPPDKAIGTLAPTEAYSALIAGDTLGDAETFLQAFPHDSLAPRVAMIAAVRREALFWMAAAHANDPRAYWTYMRRYPRGAHFYDARRQLALLAAPLEPPPRFDIETFPDLAPPTPDEAASIDRQDIVFEDPDWETIPAPPASILPLADPAFYENVPPPPSRDGMLAIPAPLAIAGARPSAFGTITQPFVKGHSVILAETTMTPAGASTVTVSEAGKIISRTMSSLDLAGRRTIVQTGPDGIVMSRTASLRDAAGSTVVQTGANGGVLTKAVTWHESDGRWSTVVRSGDNRVVEDISRDRNGIVRLPLNALRRIVAARPFMAPVPFAGKIATVDGRVGLPKGSSPVAAPAQPLPHQPPKLEIGPPSVQAPMPTAAKAPPITTSARPIAMKAVPLDARSEPPPPVQPLAKGAAPGPMPPMPVARPRPAPKSTPKTTRTSARPSKAVRGVAKRRK